MEIQWLSQFPSKKRSWYWEFEILPHVSIARDPSEGFAIGVGWLFWTVALFVDL